MKKYYSFLLVMLFLGSCTITKRHYNNGWHVEWHKKPQSNSNELTAESNPTTVVAETDETSEKFNDSIPEKVLTVEPSTDLTSASSSSSSTVSTTKDQLSSSGEFNTDIEIQHSSDKKDASSDEEAKPEKKKSERIMPIALAIVLAFLLLALSGIIGYGIGYIVFIIVEIFASSFFPYFFGLLLGAIPVFVALCLSFHLFNRKETIYKSEKERNLRYLLYSFLIITLLVIIGVLVFL